MTFKPMNTADAGTGLRKTLIYGHAGWGKTTQAKHFKRHFGKGFIISGEAGLASIRNEGIDYLPFTSFDGPVDEASGVYSFTHICRMIMSPDFKAAGYKWIMLDSLTELSDMVFSWADARAEANAVRVNKPKNGFEVWGEYKDKMIGACKFVRDLPYHVIITALEKSTEDDNGVVTHIPLLQGSAVQAQVPGIFDNVLCCTTKTVKDAAGVEVTERYVVTASYQGWQGKVRDESGSVLTVETTGDITSILKKMDIAK